MTRNIVISGSPSEVSAVAGSRASGLPKNLHRPWPSRIRSGSLGNVEVGTAGTPGTLEQRANPRTTLPLFSCREAVSAVCRLRSFAWASSQHPTRTDRRTQAARVLPQELRGGAKPQNPGTAGALGTACLHLCRRNGSGLRRTILVPGAPRPLAPSRSTLPSLGQFATVTLFCRRVV